MKAILAKTTTDIHKSKIRSSELSELCLELYISPSEFAQILEKYDDEEFEITLGNK